MMNAPKSNPTFSLSFLRPLSNSVAYLTFGYLVNLLPISIEQAVYASEFQHSPPVSQILSQNLEDNEGLYGDYDTDDASGTSITDGSTQATGFGGDKRPGRQTSGDTRGYCVATGSPVLTGLIPDSNLGTTVSPSPNLWFYVPDTPEEAVKGYFVLQDEEGNDVIDEIEFDFPNQAGYISISLPSEFALEVGAEYQWAFELECSPSEPTIYVEGWIKRIPLELGLQAQLTATNSEHYKIYTENYIWFDAIDNLAAQRLADPNNPALIEAWNSLLSQGGGNLDNLPEQPILGYITALP